MQPILSHIESTYKVLGHKEKEHYTLLSCIDVNRKKQLSRVHVNDCQSVIEWVKEWNGKGNLFIGRNPRNADGEVAAITCVSVDLDPVREKGTASSAEQLREALSLGQALVAQERFKDGVVASSGNGCQIFWPLPDPYVSGFKDVEERTKLFEEEVRQYVKTKTKSLTVDSIYDSPRLVKLIGSLSTKGKPEEARLSRFIVSINWERAFSGTIFKTLQGYSTYKQMEAITGLSKTEGLDRSALDFGLALRLKREGATDTDIRTYLQAHGYRCPERPDDIERILEKLRNEHIQQRGNSYSEPQQYEHKPVIIYTAGSDWEEYEQRRQQRTNGDKGQPELPFGIPALDSLTSGLKRGGLWVVGARTGVGKTSFSITVVDNVLRAGKKVLFFSTEMDQFAVKDRLISCGSGIGLFRLETNTLTEEETKRYREYCEEFKTRNLYIVDEPEPSLREVDEAISRVLPDILVFDHIQRISSGTDSRYLELSKFTKGLNTLCRTYNIAGIINSQLNRIAALEQPALHHLKECGALEEEAHGVILLSIASKNMTDPELRVIADVAKNRGPKAVLELKFDKSTTRFRGQ